MWKKIGIVVVCCVTILSILGTNGNFNYAGFKVATTMISDSVDEVVDSFAKSSLFLHITQNWTPNCTVLVDEFNGYKLDSDGMATDIPEYYIIVTMVYWSDQEDPEGGYLVDYTLNETFTYATQEARDKALWVADLYSQGKPDNWFETTLNGVTFSFAEILNFFYGATNVVFDTGGVIVSIGRALLYLLGF